MAGILKRGSEQTLNIFLVGGDNVLGPYVHGELLREDN